MGPPGVGKTVALSPAANLLRRSRACFLAPNDMTKQGLLDALSNCGKVMVMNSGEMVEYHYMSVFISEMSDFMPAYDAALAGVLTNLYDNPFVNEESKRHGLGKTITSPGISLLLGTATGNLGQTVSHEAWDSGFMARFILVYSEEKISPKDMFAKREGGFTIAREIEERLKELGQLKGPMKWQKGAQEALQDFRDNGLTEGVLPPNHPKLVHYLTRRWAHLAKLCMISALSGGRMIVADEDVARAKGWLLEAETTMERVFAEMVRSEDGAVLRELQAHLRPLAIRRGSTGLSAQDLYAFLAPRVRASNISKLIEVAENAGFIIRIAGTSGSTARYTLPKGEKRSSPN